MWKGSKGIDIYNAKCEGVVLCNNMQMGISALESRYLLAPGA